MDRFRSEISILFLMLFGFLLLIATTYAADRDNRGNEVSFLWSFNAMVGSEYNKRLIPVTRYNTLKKGDILKIRLELKKRCFVYFFYRTPEDRLIMLFPYSFDLFDADYKAGKTYYIPPGRTCFSLDNNAGTETFYLVASAKRLRNLEASFLKYEAASDDEKQSLARHVLAEIRTIKRQYSQLAAAAERPILIGGNVRALVKDKTSPTRTDPHKIEVSAEDAYIRTFTINHQ